MFSHSRLHSASWLATTAFFSGQPHSDSMIDPLRLGEGSRASLITATHLAQLSGGRRAGGSLTASVYLREENKRGFNVPITAIARKLEIFKS